MAQLAGERTSSTRAAADGGPEGDFDGDAPGDAESGDRTQRTSPSDKWSMWRDRIRGGGRWLLRPDLAATMVVAAVLRFWGIGAQSVWYDEWLTTKAASGSLYSLGQYVVGSAGIPPTYFGFMWGWARVVGDSDAALRSFSALVGVAMVPLVYALAAEFGQRRAVARLAGVLIAVNPMLVWYSQEARPYTLMAFLGGLTLWAMARTLTRGGRWDLVVWVSLCTLTFAVHYYAVFLVLAEALALLAIRRPQIPQLLASLRSQPRVWLRALRPALVLLVGLAPFAAKQFASRGQHAWIEDQDFAQRLRGVGTGVLVGPSPPNGRIWMALAAIVAFAVVLLVVRGNLVERLVAAAVAILGVGAVALTLAAKPVGVDAVIERYLIFVLVPLVMVVAIGLGVSRVPAWVGGLAATVIVALSLVVVVSVAKEPELQRTDWQAVADAHEAVGTDDGARILVMNDQGYLGGPLRRYLDDAVPLREDDERVRVEHIDVIAFRDTTFPCNGLIGRSCNFFFLGGIPPAVWSDYEPAELAELAGIELAELEELVDQAELGPEDMDDWSPVNLADVAGLGDLEPNALDEWVETVELDQFDVHRYELDEPRWLTREDLVRARWDGAWKALVLVPEGSVVDPSED